MIRKKPKNHWGFAQGKHCAFACAFIRCTPKPPFTGNAAPMVGKMQSARVVSELCFKPFRCRWLFIKSAFAAISVSRLAGLAVTAQQDPPDRTPRLALPRRVFGWNASANLRYAERQRAGPGVLSCPFPAPNRFLGAD